MSSQWLVKLCGLAAALSLAVGLASCTGSTQIAGGGIGGTGSGVGFGEITGFGSIRFNDDSVFQTDDNTEFFIDGVQFDDEAAFKAAFGGTDDAVGAVAIVEIGDDIDDSFTAGTALRVDARTAVKGPVTGTNPLTVLGQTIVVTGTTVLADLADITLLALGDQVEVSGFTDQGNNLLATRLQYKSGGLTEWKLTGFVNANTVDTFTVATQTVSLSGGVSARDCGAATPPVGSFVEVKAVPVSGFAPGSPLVASDVECKSRGLSSELDASGINLRRIQGFISATAGDILGTAGTLTIGGAGAAGQVVQLNAATVFNGGTRVDLGIGVRVEITGQFNATTGVLTASRVSFRESRVRIEATLLPQNVNAGAGTLTLLGITVHRLPITEDEDNFFGGGQPARDVRMRGYVDRDGTVYATEIEDRDDPGEEDLRLRGPVDDGFSNPNFSILGVQINLQGTPIFRDDDVVISQAEFFSRLTPGRPVQVDEGVFSAGPPPTITNPSEIELED